MSGTKPVVRVQAGSSPADADMNKAFMTGDSFVNFKANLGYGTANLSSGGTYGFNPISRNHTMLEWMYRGSWLVRKVIDAVADDMTRAGTAVESDVPPDRIDLLHQYWNQRQIWRRINLTIKWARLYGGAIAVIMIDGQKPETPLRINTVGKGQFKGLMVLDRWMVWPHLEDLVTEFGSDFGLPRFYEVVADARSVPRMKVHHSRVIRIDGDDLPYFQKIAENEWGLSVIEPLFDRMIAYDSATQGAAQLIYRAHLRVLKIPKMRDLIAFGGKAYQAFLQYVQIMRLMQTNEGITLLDGEDSFDAHQYAFGGLSDMLVQFGQQLSGAADIPLTRLFGQAPAGMNATGESDMRNYYDGIKANQESQLRDGITKLYRITFQSCFNEKLPEGFNFSFNPLWLLDDVSKVNHANILTQAVDSAVQSGLVSPQVALRELRQGSRVNGVWSNITDEDIEAAQDTVLPSPEMQGMQPGMDPNDPNAQQEQEQGQLPGPEQQDEGQAALPGIGFDPNDSVHVHVHRYLHEPEVEPGAHDAATVDADAVYPMRDVHGIQVVIETPKDTRRLGYGWAVQMPADYGYISATSSAEGHMEQMDCYVGDEPDSQLVWIIDQVEPDTGLFDEHKIMMCFGSKEAALATYRAAFDDGKGEQRIGTVRRMHVDVLKQWLKDWQPQGAVGAMADVATDR